MSTYTFEEIVHFLEALGKFSVKNNLEHTARMFALLDHPERKVPVIHVAGTNGKGSTCVFLASVLKESGRKTALFISPHLIRITERMSVNGTEISEEDFAAAGGRVREAAERMVSEGNTYPSWFEFLFLMAMVWFAEQQVDIAVLETGLGGRLDATNTIRNPLLTVITQIGLDHTQYLGNTIEEVAYEKAGILKEGVPCAAMPGDERAARVIRERAAELHAPLTILDKKDLTRVRQKDGVIDFSLSFRYDGRADFSIPAYALYQAENAALALAGLKALRDHRDSFGDLTAENAAAGLYAFHFQARMQNPEKDVWLDGANNPDGIRVLLDSFSAYAKKRRKVLLFAAMKDKDISAMIRHLSEKEQWDRCFVTSADAWRGADPARLAELFSENGVDAETIPDPLEAYKCAREEMRGGVLLVCGSLYLAGTILDRADSLME